MIIKTTVLYTYVLIKNITYNVVPYYVSYELKIFKNHFLKASDMPMFFNY